jgi:hypothetical protein
MANWQNLQLVASGQRGQRGLPIPELFRSCQHEKRENDMKCNATPEHNGMVLRLMEKEDTVTTYRSEAGVRSPTLVVEGAVHALCGLTAAISPSAVADSFVRADQTRNGY